MMCRKYHISGFLLFFIKISLFAQSCPDAYFNIDASLPNSCIKYRAFVGVNINDTLPESLTVSINFGDGSTIVSNPYSFPAASLNYIESPHVYSSPGTYNAIVTLTGPGTCSFSQTALISVSGFCQTCPTYSNLSTGFDRINNVPFSTSGTYDPYWYVIDKQDLTGLPGYNPIPGTTIPYSNTLAYDIYSNYSTLGPMGTSSYISINPTSYTPFINLNVVTYRTYFNLPNPMPTSKTYSLVMNIRGDDAIYEVKLNGIDIQPPGYTSFGGAYGGSPLSLSANSCGSNLFLPGSNYIDIRLSDLGLAITQLDAEILLYDCATTCSVSQYCSDCISSFSPIPGKKYLISAWVKETSAAQSKTTYNWPTIDISYPSVPGTTASFPTVGNIIDGWQRIEGAFTIPTNATDILVQLSCSSPVDCYYDDVRILPFDGSLKSFVYDPVSMRLVAELDEQNYATLYEYDEEGKLIRVKKETEKGKMTIQENRNNTRK